jgi:hypothetical protein
VLDAQRQHDDTDPILAHAPYLSFGVTE